jgi:hypothetical protein
LSDPLPTDFLRSASGSIDFGQIDKAAAAAIGSQPGPIRLQYGYGGPKGWGLLHVVTSPRRLDDIRGIGYSDFQDYATDVAQSYTEIGQGKPAHRYIPIYRKICPSAW